MTGIEEESQGKGIVQKLMKETLNIRKKKNYKSIITESTGFVPQQILAKRYGFKVLKQIEYKSYLYNYQQVFKDIKDTSHCKLMMKTYT